MLMFKTVQQFHNLNINEHVTIWFLARLNKLLRFVYNAKFLSEIEICSMTSGTHGVKQTSDRTGTSMSRWTACLGPRTPACLQRPTVREFPSVSQLF